LFAYGQFQQPCHQNRRVIGTGGTPNLVAAC
jgi:hypothetical protein